MRLDRAPSVLLGQLRLVRTAPAIPILMYHSISETDERNVSPYYRLTTSPRQFRRQMCWLREHGYEIIDLPEALRRLNDPTLDTRCLVLTFDDGFHDFLSDASPILAEFGFTATVFLPTAYIGNRRRAFKRRPCLTWAEVRALRGHGVSFGAHTVTHPTLHGLPWKDVRREVRESRRRIEDEIQAAVDTFAYPYAFPREDREFVKHLRHELIESGYTSAVTTVVGRATPGSDCMTLKRLPVNESDDRDLFVSKLDGAYDWVGGLQTVVRRAKRYSSVVRSAWPMA